MQSQVKHNIDPDNSIERNIDGCTVRLFFSSSRNERAERLVLDNLMLVFDLKIRKKEETIDDEAGKLSVPRINQTASR